MKAKSLFFGAIFSALLCISSVSQAEGWKSGTLTQTGTSSEDYGGCFAYFVPDAYTEGTQGMSECNSNGGVYYVSLDCQATTAPSTGLTKSTASSNFGQAQLAAVADKAIGLYVVNVQIGGFCVATATSVIY
jgi:hypothetical protein